ncbi:MAG: hypothetical protein QM711_18550 [Micropruina sp.]|uniref:hypothetical protein n=1 Tax=Micropruina sp. TaxID=2737536 RepID=UPI0039E726BC
MTTPATLTQRPSTRDYSALMRCDDAGPWLVDAVAQVKHWLREKGFDVDLDASVDQSTATATLAVRRLEAGDAVDLRIQLVEEQVTGTWATEFIAHDEPGADDWINVVVSNSRGRFVAVPRLARYLMQVLQLHDGLIEFVDQPQVFGPERLDDLVALLSDEARHGLVFVAGTNDKIPFQAFARKLGAWTKEINGLGQVILLTPDATAALIDRGKPQFAAPPWTIRTYQPGVKFDDPSDARRHRILGTTRLASEKDSVILTLLGDVARQQAATRPVDPAVRSTRRRFERLENRRLVEEVAVAVTPVPEEAPPTAEPESVEPSTPVKGTPQPKVSEIGLVKRILGLKEITEQALLDLMSRARQWGVDRASAQALQRRVDELLSKVEQLEDANTDLLAALDDEQSTNELLHLDLDDHGGKINWLQSRLKDRGDYEAAYLNTPDNFRVERPDSFEKLLDLIESTDGVSFTGNASDVLRLSQIDTNDAALRTAWDAVLALADYAKARANGDCASGLDHYLKHTPTGYRTVSSNKFGDTETGITMRRFGKERIFPVPTSVHPAGHVEMKAHFKLARTGMTSPRMHIYDGHPAAPCVFIGYIGPHLTNTHTR